MYIVHIQERIGRMRKGDDPRLANGTGICLSWKSHALRFHNGPPEYHLPH